ncbi:MAG: TIGR02281 family clan AA aspartic protease [Gammaproteobacteria bacterium]|jgi:aspartyl protease family protein|nr:TIGR02281 family clan AA aspartic protease [Gammaproteobacteria bacterium]
MKINRALWCVALCFWSLCFASEVRILGLFKDKVMIEIDGQTHTLEVGKESSGIRLISADSKGCVLEINGKEQEYTMGSHISIRFRPAEKPIVRIAQDNAGMYRTTGSINGVTVNFIIDTGASYVTMNVNQAKSLGIDYQSKPVQVETAGGRAKAFLITLDQISIGDIRVFDVPAVVVDGSSPKEVLLGMSFLKRLEISDNHQLMELKQKY